MKFVLIFRDGDIMLSVNDNPVKSAALAASMIQCILTYSKNSKLRMVSDSYKNSL